MAVQHYPSVGQCIYCGDDQSKLTDEHIIPFSLGGDLIFDKASCLKCNEITKRFEGVVGRSIFGHFRAKHDIRTRNPKERPTHFPYSTEGGEKWAPAKQLPTMLWIYKFYEPTILSGHPASMDISNSHWVPISISSKPEMDAFKKTHQWDGKATVRMQPWPYARMFCKAAHAYAIAMLGLGKFRPLAVDLILGRSTNFSHVFGGGWEMEPGIEGGQHELTLTGITLPEHRLHLWVVRIRLFSSMESPAHQIVVGSIESQEHIRFMYEQMSKSGSVEISYPPRHINPRSGLSGGGV